MTLKRLIIIGLFVIVPSVMAQDNKKVWVHIEYEEHGDRVIFIQDLETGTRCYALTNISNNLGGYAISCVKQ